MSRLLDFYRGQDTDSAGRWLADYWTWDNERLEARHDFIQWMFPLPDPSRFNAGAPLVTEEDRQAFLREEVLRRNLQRSLERFLAFLGLRLDEQGDVHEREDFAERVPDVWAYPNHNWLRITRVLRTLTLLGLAAPARALYRYLEALCHSRRYPIPADTFQYWTEAVTGVPFHR